jgi:hypothetical protein
MSDKPTLKRYAIILQHEVIIYGYDLESAKQTAIAAYAAKVKCVSGKELPPVEVEAEGIAVIDKRNAPGQ